MNIREMIGEHRINKGLWWGEGVNLVTGCTRLSPACDNCWSLAMSDRLGKDNGEVVFHHDRLNRFKKEKPTVFSIWNDLFHESIGYDLVAGTLANMMNNPANQHLYLVLTKRPERAVEFFGFKSNSFMFRNMPTLWLGTTVESNDYLHRVDDLLKLKPYASKLFVSVEPMLGEVDLETEYGQGIGDLRIENLDLIICGSESGPNRRPTDIDWIRNLRDQCQGAGVPFFLKQMEINGKLVKAPELDGRQWLQLPGMGE